MKRRLWTTHQNVAWGQCKGALCRIQFRRTALFLFPGWVPGWAGSHVGIFAPSPPDWRRCRAFYFRPWLAPDIGVGQLPRWYLAIARRLRFHFELPSREDTNDD